MEIVNRSLAFQPAGLWKRSEMSKDRRLWLDMRKWIWAKILWPCIKGIIKSKKSRFSARIYRVSSYPRHFRDISGTFPGHFHDFPPHIFPCNLSKNVSKKNSLEQHQTTIMSHDSFVSVISGVSSHRKLNNDPCIVSPQIMNHKRCNTVWYTRYRCIIQMDIALW